ncbi:MAG: M1 family metallopeptidase, partial [Candidatus Marinimicrobia bacterium]|nr:M1 family metallopeptidase [Candidatus Neomarinimicrobiota bacterium]
MKKRIFPFLFLTFVLSEKDYFQQHVAYDISVELDDKAHTLSAYEKIIYTNNSPDTLNFIWFHLWPNAYKNDSSALAKQFLRLGSTRFKYTKEKDRGYIDSLDFSIDGIDTEWQFHTNWIDVAKVTLPKPLPPKGTVTIETPFFIKLPEVISRLGHTGKHYEITQWYPKPAVYDKDGWHPMPYLNMGEFYSEFGSFDVKITLPKNYRIMATGDLVNSETELAWLDSLASIGDSLNTLEDKEFKKAIKKLQKESKKAKKKKKDTHAESEDSVVVKTVHFRQDKVHDFAWFADPYWIVQKGKLWLEDSTRQVTLWSMYLPKNGKLWKSSIEYLHDAGFWYSRFYGDYPYNHITAVDGDMSAGGGMEYPNITVISRSGSADLLEFVIMHEVGHNWFYGILGNNERDHTWMDEGLNEYTNIRYWEKKYYERNNQVLLQDFIQNKLGVGKTFDIHSFHYLAFAGIGKSKDAQPLNISADDNFNNSNYGQNYTRTAVMMRFLQHYLGEEKMDDIMQDFYETWKFRHPQPDDLKFFFDKHIDEDITWFFENVFETTSYID